MTLFHRSRTCRRKAWCLNAGLGYGALAALLFVVIKTLKYSGGGGRQDLPWAILIILAAGLIGGFLWQLGHALFDPRGKPKGNGQGQGEEAPPDRSRR